MSWINKRFVVYCILSHAKENTANQKPGMPLHILRYPTRSIPLNFLVITCAQQLCWRLFEDYSESSPVLSNSANSSDYVRKFPESFRRVSEKFKNLEISKTVLNRFRTTLKISEHFQKSLYGLE